jgi:hypothetical protein
MDNVQNCDSYINIPSSQPMDLNPLKFILIFFKMYQNTPYPHYQN